jgi:hypothetical protein
MASIAILVYAVATMVRNRQPRWDNLLFIPAALFLFALGLQVLPPLFMKSARIGLADSNAEAILLREELRGWLPEALPTVPGDNEPEQASNPADATPVPAAATPTATATPWVIYFTPEPDISVITATPLPTATPIPPTATPLPICLGTRDSWLPGCVLPTPPMTDLN